MTGTSPPFVQSFVDPARETTSDPDHGQRLALELPPRTKRIGWIMAYCHERLLADLGTARSSVPCLGKNPACPQDQSRLSRPEDALGIILPARHTNIPKRDRQRLEGLTRIIHRAIEA